MGKELVSILIPCYNAELYLEDCLEAINNQTYKKIETIIVNDGSTDNSEKIIDKYIEIFKKSNKKLIKINQENQGQASACNNGIKYVTGEYLYWQDSDDVLELDAIESMVNFLNNNKEYELVRGNVSFRNEDNFEKITNIGKPINPKKTNIFDDYIFEKGSYCFVGIFMVRMDYFDKCNPKRELYISSGGQNYQLLLPITYKGKCGYIDKEIYKYRIRANSHSHSIKKLKDLISRCNVHQDIILKTLNLITSMSQKERCYYGFKIRFKYLKRKIKILLKYNFKKVLKGLYIWKK